MYGYIYVYTNKPRKIKGFDLKNKMRRIFENAFYVNSLFTFKTYLPFSMIAIIEP